MAVTGMRLCRSSPLRWGPLSASSLSPAALGTPPHAMHQLSPLPPTPRLGIHAYGRVEASMRGRSTWARTRATSEDSENPEVYTNAVKDGYDAKENAEYWATRPIPVLARLMRIGIEFANWYLLSKLGEPSAPLLRSTLVKLGPAFVKIGQAVSSRPDLMSPEFLTELEKLQDRIPAYPSEDAYQMLENELGAPVNTIFASLSPEPVAAASLGQVYRGVVASQGSVAGGQEVAVKVQRPGVVEMIAMDVYIMRYMAAVLRKIGKLNTDLPTVVDEWATSLFKELDYTREAANARRFKTLFARMPEVYVPEVYDGLTTPKVLTMEWVDGERLRSASSEERIDSALGNQDDLDLVEVGVRCSLEQMLEEGFYHADPHPGNLLRMPDGRLCYLDFGMMGETSLEIRQGLVRATLHLVNKEYESLADDFITLGFLPPDSDKSRIIPALTGVFQAALSGGVGNLSFSDLGVNLGRTMYQYKFQLPSYFTLLFRSLSVLEGIALASDPQYKVLSAAYPWVARRLLTDKSPALNNTLQALLYKEGDVFQFERLQGLLEQAAKMKALRLAAPRQGYEAAPTTPGTLSSGMPADASPLRLLLSEDGAFVRGILLEELAKSVDGFGRLTVDTSIYTGRKRAAVAGSFANFPLAWPVLTLLPSRNYPPLPLPWPWDGVALAWSTAFGQGGSRGSSNGDPDPGVALREYFFASEKEEGKSGNSSGGRTPQPNSKGGTDIVTIDAVVTPLTYDSPSPSGPVMRQLGPDGPKPSPKPASAPPQPPQTGADDTYSGRALGPTPTRPTESSSLASGPPSSGSGSHISRHRSFPPSLLDTYLSSFSMYTEPSDWVQLQGLIHLARTVAMLASLPESSQLSSPALANIAKAVDQVAGPQSSRGILQVASFLKYVVDEAISLPPAARSEALQLPYQLLSRVASRAAARGVRASAMGKERTHA